MGLNIALAELLAIAATREDEPEVKVEFDALGQARLNEVQQATLIRRGEYVVGPGGKGVVMAEKKADRLSSGSKLCACGRTISANKPSCFDCNYKDVED